MNEVPHEHTLETAPFLSATLKAIDHEYEYVSSKIGQEGIIRDIDQKKIAHAAIGILQRADVGAYTTDQEDYFDQDTPLVISASDEASVEHLRLLADELGSINGYRLTLITDVKMILDQIVRTKDDCLMVISLEASLSPLGVTVAKDRHIAQHGRGVMKDVLEVGPEDVAIIDQFIQKIIDLP